MGFIIFILFLCLPAAEIWVIGRVSSVLGFWDTFFLLIFSAVFGVYLAKHQGRSVLIKVQQTVAEGRTPTIEMLDGLLIFLGGVLFVIPGFITDLFGLLFVLPPTRWVIRWLIARKLARGFTAPQPPRQPAKEPPNPRGQIEDAQIVE